MGTAANAMASPAPTAIAGAERIDDTAAARRTERRRSDMVLAPLNSHERNRYWHCARTRLVPECYNLSAAICDHLVTCCARSTASRRQRGAIPATTMAWANFLSADS